MLLCGLAPSGPQRDDSGMHKRIAAVALLLALTSCSSMRYDLEGVGFPVQANAASNGAGEEFSLQSKYVIYVHGLLGEKQPKVAELLQAHCGDAKAVTDFRVSAGASIWDWLGTHLSLGLVRLKTVQISGRVVRAAGKVASMPTLHRSAGRSNGAAATAQRALNQ